MRSVVTRPRESHGKVVVVALSTNRRPHAPTSNTPIPAPKPAVPQTFVLGDYELPLSMGWLKSAEPDVVAATLALPEHAKFKTKKAEAEKASDA